MNDRDGKIGEQILEAILNSNIDSISNLNLYCNWSWFCKNPYTYEERFSNIELLKELLSKQTSLLHLNIGANYISNSATETILTRILESATHSRL